MPNSTSTSISSTAAVPKPRAIIVGSGERTKSNTCSGSEIIGPENGLKLSTAVTPEVSSTGEVSPMPRAVPRMTAVTSPDRAVGSTTPHTVRQRPAPRAYDASRRLPGTRRSTTSAARMTMGSIITVIASAAANPERWCVTSWMTAA